MLLGFRTLDRIDAATWEQRSAGVKISRAEVGKVIFDTGLAVLRRGGVRKLAGSSFA